MELYPKRFNRYYEPFLGSGAVFLDLASLERIRYAVIDKKALSAYNTQSNYTVTYNIEVKFEGTTGNYIINITINLMHGDGTYLIYLTGWVIRYVIKEELGLVEKQKQILTLNYYRTSYKCDYCIIYL